jgi:hypothetical protein
MLFVVIGGLILINLSCNTLILTKKYPSDITECRFPAHRTCPHSDSMSRREIISFGGNYLTAIKHTITFLTKRGGPYRERFGGAINVKSTVVQAGSVFGKPAVAAVALVHLCFVSRP